MDEDYKIPQVKIEEEIQQTPPRAHRKTSLEAVNFIRKYTSNDDDSDSESDSEDEIENQKSKLWCLIALTISILRCALFLFCLGACFVIFVIFTHEDSSG